MVKEKKQGQVIVAAVFVLVIVALLGIVAVSILSTESFSVVKNLQGIQALNVAEGGIQFTVATSLAADTNWSNNTDFGPVILNPGTFRVHYLLKSMRTCWLEVTGTVSGVSRVVRARARKGPNLLYQFTDFGAYAGNPGSVGGELKFQNASRIIGSFYYYGPINILNSSLPCQTGGIIMSTSINPPAETGIPTYYESWEQVSTAEPVPWDNTYYDNWLTFANQAGAADPNWNNASVDLGTYANRTAIYRGVTIKGNTTITGPGTICATGVPSGGDFETKGGSNVRFVGPIRIIARGTATFNGAGVFTASPEVIALSNLTISDTTTTPASSILYTKASGSSSFLIDKQAIVRGSILAPYGEITSKNSGWIQGLVYADSYQAYTDSKLEGGGVFKSTGYFHNDSQVIQNADVLPPTLPPGISPESTSTASWEIYNWREAY